MPDSDRSRVESVIDYLFCQEGYDQRGDRLYRQDGTVAAEFIDRKWISYASPEEFALYMASSGRGFPSKLVIQDPTNPGHACHPDTIRNYPISNPTNALCGLTPPPEITRVLCREDVESGLLKLIYSMGK